MQNLNLTFSELERKLYIENNPAHAVLIATIDEISDEISDDFEEHYESGHCDGFDQGAL